jgi:hypothetical protein
VFLSGVTSKKAVNSWPYFPAPSDRYMNGRVIISLVIYEVAWSLKRCSITETTSEPPPYHLAIIKGKHLRASKLYRD